MLPTPQLRCIAATLCLAAVLSTSAYADPAARLFQLVSIPGVSGHEQAVREFIELALPPTARVRADSMGNIALRTGTGSPHTLVVAPLDESGLVVSAITTDGYVRAHRHTTAPGARLATQYLIGQPVQIRAADGQLIPGVTATPSTHLRAFRDAEDEARIKGLDDIWIDVGAESAAAVEKLGVRMLDSITLRERAAHLARGRVAGVGAAGRAAALALSEVVARRTSAGRPSGTVTVAWVVQSDYGQRGLLRVLETVKPDRVILLRGSVSPGDDPAGAIGVLGGGPVLVGDRSFLSEVAAGAGISSQGITAFAIDTFVTSDTPVDIQRLAGARLGQGAVLRGLDSRTLVPPPIIDRIVALARAKKIPLQIGVTGGGTDASVFSEGGSIDVGLSWPGRYSHSPVEVMDRRDLEALVNLIAALALEY